MLKILVSDRDKLGQAGRSGGLKNKREGVPPLSEAAIPASGCLQ